MIVFYYTFELQCTATVAQVEKIYSNTSTNAGSFLLYWLLKIAIWQFDTTNTNALYPSQNYNKLLFTLAPPYALNAWDLLVKKTKYMGT